MYNIAYKIIRPYTTYSIILENYEYKDFTQGLWEMWGTIELLLNSDLDEDSLSETIEKLSNEIVKNYWAYIDNLFNGIKPYCSNYLDVLNECLDRIEQMKKNEMVDERALEILRQLEERVY